MTGETATGFVAAAPAATSSSSRKEKAQKLVKKYMWASGGISLVPLPFLDQISIGALLGKMIYDIGQLYEVKIEKYRVKGILASILGGAHAGWIPRYLMGYLVLLIPGINLIGALVVRPTIAATVTHVIGKIFIRQFESGRTLADFDVEQARKEFVAHFKMPSIQDVANTSDALHLDLSDGRRIAVPLEWFPKLAQAKQSERDNWQLMEQGHVIHWPDLDTEVLVEELIAGKPSEKK